MTSGSSDLDAGIFYVRIQVDGEAKLTACSVCAVCHAIVPAKVTDEHHEYHARATK